MPIAGSNLYNPNSLLTFIQEREKQKLEKTQSLAKKEAPKTITARDNIVMGSLLTVIIVLAIFVFKPIIIKKRQ